MKCTACGNEIRPGDKFCTHCGLRLEENGGGIAEQAPELKPEESVKSAGADVKRERRNVGFKFALLAAFIAFFFPFCTVSCAGQAIVDPSGYELAGDWGMTADQMEILGVTTADTAHVVIIVVLLIMFAAFLATTRPVINSGQAAVSALLLYAFKHSSDWDNFREAGLDVSFRFGYWLAFFALILAATASLWAPPLVGKIEALCLTGNTEGQAKNGRFREAADQALGAALLVVIVIAVCSNWSAVRSWGNAFYNRDSRTRPDYGQVQYEAGPAETEEAYDSSQFEEEYGFDIAADIDPDQIIAAAASPSFKELRNGISDYKGVVICANGLVLGKYAPEDYMEGVTELAVDGNEWSTLLDQCYGYSCLNDDLDTPGSYVVITNDSSAYPNEWKQIYGYPVGVNKGGDVVIWGLFFRDADTRAQGAGQPAAETFSPAPDAGAAEVNTDYILPDSDTRYLAGSELAYLDQAALRLARNEIYARHGRMFEAENLSAYFNSKRWYSGYIAAADFDDSVLNEYEKANLSLIKSAEDGNLQSDLPEYIAGSSRQLGAANVMNALYTAGNGTTMEIGEYSGTGEIYVNFSQNGDIIWNGVVERYQTLENGGLCMMFNGDNYMTGEMDYLEVEWSTMARQKTPVVYHESDAISISGTYTFSYPLFGN